MPYDIKDKLARRGFWFIFTKNERPTVKEGYTFDAEVTIKGDSKPLLTLDSTKHTFWYKTLTEKNDAEYKKIPAGGIGVDDLPCIVAFHVQLPPDSEVTVKARATDWKDAVISEKNKLNVQDFKDITEIRLDIVAGYRWDDTEPSPSCDIPVLPPVPIVLLDAQGELPVSSPKKLSAAAHVLVYDWTGRKPQVFVNGDQATGTPKHVNAKEVGDADTDADTYCPPVPFVWEVDAKGIKQPRIEVTASNGQYCGASCLKYLAKARNDALSGFAAANGLTLAAPAKKSGKDDNELLAKAFETRRATVASGRKTRVLGESLPFAPTPEEAHKYYAVRTRLTGEPLVTVGDSASLDFWGDNGATLDFGSRSNVKLECLGAGIPTDTKMLVKASGTDEWKEKRVSYEGLRYRTRPLLCIEKANEAAKGHVNPGVFFADVGKLLAVGINNSSGYKGNGTANRRMLAHVLGLTAVAQCAGFIDRTASKAVSDNATATGAEPSLCLHTWATQVPELSYAEGHRPKVEPKPGKKSRPIGAENGLLTFTLQKQIYEGERCYLRRYGCEESHPVRLWQHDKQPTADEYTEPMWPLSRARMIEEFRGPGGAQHLSAFRRAALGEDGLLSDTSWNLMYTVYLSGHLHGFRLGHPAPDDAVFLFDGWPGLAPAFKFDGAQVELPPGQELVSIPDHANLTSGRDIVTILQTQGNQAALKEWLRQVGRYKSVVNRNIQSSVSAKKFTVYPKTTVTKPEHLGEYIVSPVIALVQIAQYLHKNPECESVSLGGYSIGTNRALWLADAMEGRFRVYIPKSTTLERYIRVADSGEKEVLGKSYKPWAMNNFDLFDVLKRRICVNHMAFMDFNFGSATYLPYTTKFSIPTNVRQVHHVYSTGRMTAGVRHYLYRRGGVQAVRGWERTLALAQSLLGKSQAERLSDMLDARARRFCCHRSILSSSRTPRLVRPPADILAHTANLWETYEKRLRVATVGKVHFPQKGLAEMDLGELKMVFEEDLPRALEALKKIKIDGKPLTYPHRAELDRLIAKVKRRDVAIEDIAKEAVPVLIKFALWLLYDVVMMLLDRLFWALVEAGMPDVNPIKNIIDMKELIETILAWKAFYDKVIAALNLVFEKLYWAADTQMMLAYSEDGVANSSGGGFIFKTAGKQGTGLLHPGGTFCPLPIDHLEMGSDVRRDASKFVVEALSGKHGQIR